ncbi:PAS domain S-box protein [Methylophilaceae bacterium]|nr:PAS domain S-box protein [Methylophilaceae bacterium]
MLVFIVTLMFVMMTSSKNSILEGVESAHKVTMQLLDTVIVSSAQNPNWETTNNVMAQFLVQLGYVRSNDIYLYDSENNLVYKTPQSTYRLDVHPPEWFSNFLAPKKMVVTRDIRSGRLIVASNPSGAIREAWVQIKSIFFTAMLLFVFINFIAYKALGGWLRPIKPMIKAIEKMGKGDLGSRIPNFNVPEFSAIANNFNMMGDSLENQILENERLAMIAEQTADAVMIHDEKLKITFWNKSAERIFKYKKKDILGKSAKTIVPEFLLEEFNKNLKKLKSKNFIQNYESKRRSKTGKLVDVSISASLLMDPITKKVIGDIVSMRDISEKIVAKRSRAELQKNRELTTIIQEHVEDERKSLARELHDELGQYVSAIKIFSQNILNRSKGKDEAIETSASSVTAAANQIYDGMHNIIRQLRPGSLDNLGLSETIKDEMNKWQSQHQALKVNLIIKGNIDLLGEVININVYRIIQEAMNNVVKHAKASTIKISLLKTKDTLKIECIDNGKGFDLTILKKTKQFGLMGIKERAQALSGKFDIKSNEKKGTHLTIVIPTK